MKQRFLVLALAAVAAVAGWSYMSFGPGDLPFVSAPPTTAASPDIEELLVKLVVVDKLPDVPGYERGCGVNKKTKFREKCVYGPAWQDPTNHSGCDTRSRILAAQLTRLQFKPGTRGCKVVGGVLDPDPYSGQTMTLTPGDPSGIEIDHIFALQRNWNAGGAQWDLRKRQIFANDIDNLLAVNGRLNESKGSAGLEWLPPNTNFRCTYVQRYLAIAVKYQLPVTRSDQNIARTTCRA